MIKTDFGKRLREKRKEKGLSQEKLGKVIGVKRQAISRYELGDIAPNLDNLVKLSRALDISADYLLGIKDD